MKKTMTIIAAAGLLAFYAQAAGNFVHEDGTVVWTNDSGTAVNSGELIDIGERFGIALADIATNTHGTVATRGIFSLARGVTSAVSQGAKMYYNSATAVDTTYTADEYVGLCAEGVAVCTELTNSLGQANKFVWVDLNAPQIDFVGAFTGQAPSAHTPTITITRQAPGAQTPTITVTLQTATGYDSTGAAITNAAGDVMGIVTGATATCSALLDYPTNVTAASSALPLFLTNGTITVYP